jgi:hypothetical protein
MSQEDWIETQVNKASEQLPLITEAVKARLKTLLKNQFRNHLNPTELAQIATALIADMGPSKADENSQMPKKP